MGHETITPNPWMILPFAILLGTIALAPLLAGKWWLKHYAKVAIGLGAITLGYYLFGLHAGTRVLHVTHEYVSFIALIGSLFIVSGGIHIRVKGEATPMTNVIFLLIGALLANVLGTTGASMLLIRPWLNGSACFPPPPTSRESCLRPFSWVARRQRSMSGTGCRLTRIMS